MNELEYTPLKREEITLTILREAVKELDAGSNTRKKIAKVIEALEVVISFHEDEREYQYINDNINGNIR